MLARQALYQLSHLSNTCYIFFYFVCVCVCVCNNYLMSPRLVSNHVAKDNFELLIMPPPPMC